MLLGFKVLSVSLLCPDCFGPSLMRAGYQHEGDTAQHSNVSAHQAGIRVQIPDHHKATKEVSRKDQAS